MIDNQLALLSYIFFINKQIEWVEQQSVKKRIKRDLTQHDDDQDGGASLLLKRNLPALLDNRLNPNGLPLPGNSDTKAGPSGSSSTKKFPYSAPPSDPLYAQQWYLVSTQHSLDLQTLL